MNTFHVDSEFGRLRQVIPYRPGPGLSRPARHRRADRRPEDAVARPGPGHDPPARRRGPHHPHRGRRDRGTRRRLPAHRRPGLHGGAAQIWGERIELLLPYQADDKTAAATGDPDVRFAHCLQSLHDRRTRLGRELFETHGLDAFEVTDEVFSSPASLVFDQAENRPHTIKAVLVATLED
ncbi:hypothetical protein ACFSL4_13805 [Streptomyces caeni]|uniref:Aspartate/ornithine carbamoyltransferase Asp/Orn-binding domain-containing protein n=1 Tax=Streptomyces caeni TaxID=2307231 RepID=A0ABW4IPL5_9ACTN